MVRRNAFWDLPRDQMRKRIAAAESWAIRAARARMYAKFPDVTARLQKDYRSEYQRIQAETEARREEGGQAPIGQ